MVKPWNSIFAQIIISIILIILVISGLVFHYTYSETRNALQERMSDDLVVLARVAASSVDGDAVAALQPGDENTPGFYRIQQQLNLIRQSSPDIRYIYVMRKSGDGLEFVVDADYGYEPDAATVGQAYDNVTPAMGDAFAAATAEQGFTSDPWGSFLSAYAPIKDSKGDVVGIAGVDMASDRVVQQQNFIGGTIYAIIGISAFIGAGVIGFFLITIYRDLKKLIDSADMISKGNLNVFIDIWRKDEIGELAESFNRMVASLHYQKKMEPLEPDEQMVPPPR